MRRHRFRPPSAFALYVAGYSAFRMFEEQLRIDYSNHILGMRLNFWIALLLFIAAIAWFFAINRRGRRPTDDGRGGGRPRGKEPARAAKAQPAQPRA